MKNKVRVIGGGLAGSECALYLAACDVDVELIDIKPEKFTPCHHDKNFGELVCSNSLKSNDIYGNACGLLKEEMRRLGSFIIPIADRNRVPAGNALAVNRENFAAEITALIDVSPNIHKICREYNELDLSVPTVIATGPLTTDKLSNDLKNRFGGALAFFDASAPIISAESIDETKSFKADRYGEEGSGDYINCPLDKAEYELFVEELLKAERAELHEFENVRVFDGCMPVEIMASRGKETLRFGNLKPTGLTDPKTGRWPYACVQLRKENIAGDAYNLVGFQTNLKFDEQKRVFSLIPALKNAEFLRFGVMHKNTFLDSPKVLNSDFSLKEHPFIFFAGQITGVEGYVESAASGLIAAINMDRRLTGKDSLQLNKKTVIGALSAYISEPNEDFQPMNANYGILEPLTERMRDKVKKKETLSKRSLEEINKIAEVIK